MIIILFCAPLQIHTKWSNSYSTELWSNAPAAMNLPLFSMASFHHHPLTFCRLVLQLCEILTFIVLNPLLINFIGYPWFLIKTGFKSHLLSHLYIQVKPNHAQIFHLRILFNADSTTRPMLSKIKFNLKPLKVTGAILHRLQRPF